MPDKSILITGGLGFIGLHLAKHLRATAGVGRLTLLDTGNKRSPFIHSLPCGDVKLINTDVRDEQGMLDAMTGHDVVYHLAAESHVQNSIDRPREFVNTNILGTFAVLEAARKVGARVVYASTSEVYGSAQSNPMDETHPLEAQSPYAASKLAADRLVCSYVHTYGVRATIVRMFNAFGPGQHFEKLIPMFLCSALSNLPLPIQGDGSARRDWTYVSDVCDRLVTLMQDSAPPLINLGSGTTRSVAEIAQLVAELVDSAHPSVQRFARRPGHVSEQQADGAAVALKVGPIRVSFEDGLRLTVAWYRQHRHEWVDTFATERDTILFQMQ